MFLFFCVSCWLFVKFNVPEIKNRTALEIAAEFEKMHAKHGTSKDAQTDGRESQETKL